MKIDSGWRWGVAVLLFAFAGSCEDPTAVRKAPVDPRMWLVMHLDPADSIQALFVAPLERDSIHDITAELWSGNSLAATAVVAERSSACQNRYTNPLWPPTGADHHLTLCLIFDHRATHGTDYELVVSARDRPTARATTTVPGSFEIVGGVIEGDPPGTERVDLTWTRSQPNHRYLVMVRDLTKDTGFSNERGWIFTTTDTAISTYRPRDEILPPWQEDWVVSVYSVDRGLFEHITSGTQNTLFPVPPSTSVAGGLGVFGAWVRRDVPLDSLPSL